MGEENKTNKKKRHSLAYYMGGRVLTEDFIIKQSKLIFLIVGLILVFISNRYICSKKLTEMDLLNKELIELQNEQVDLSKQLTIISQQSAIEELLRQKGSTLSKDGVIVYQIKK